MSSLDHEKLMDVPLSSLRLDTENPRLPAELSEAKPSQRELLRHFAARYNLIELARSIAQKGFAPRAVEALLVIEHPTDEDVLVVIEGNRRLATLIFLTDSSARSREKLPREWKELAADAADHQLETVPVLVYKTRAELNDYLGFRHITRPKEWEPVAKARFVVKLLRSGGNTKTVARRIGSNRPTVRRYAEAFSVIRQAEAHGLAVAEAENAFGTFYNAVQHPGIRGYLGLPGAEEFEVYREDLVPQEHVERVRDLLGFLFGDRDHGLKKVISESRDIGDLGTVLQHSRARNVLIRSRDLKRAYGIAGGATQDVLEHLDEARLKLADANGIAHEVQVDAEVSEAFARVKRLVQEIGRALGLQP